MKTRWTNEMVAYLKTVYAAGHPIEQIARSLNVSKQAVRSKAFMIGLSRKRVNAWSSAEDDFLKSKIGIWPMSRIGKEIGRTPNACAARANYLGFK